MSKLLKYIFGILIASFVLIGIGIVIATRYITPEMLQEKVVHAVHDATGRNLAIKGELEWTFFPRLSIEIQEVSLSNPAGFNDNKPFADIGSLELSVSLIPLIVSRHIILDKIIVNNATINMTTLANGKTNWDDFSQTSVSKNNSANNAATKSEPKNKPIEFNIAELLIDQSSLNWNDHTKNQKWQISDLSIAGYDIELNHAFPLTMSGHYHAATTPNAAWNIDSEITIDLDKKNYVFKPIKISATIDGQKPFKLSLSELQVNELNQIIVLKDAIFSGADINGKGQLEIHNFKKQASAKGSFSFDSLALGGLKTSHINVPINAVNGVFTMDSITSQLYGGSFKGKTTVNLSGSVPQWKIQYQLNNINIQSLVSDINGTSKFSGTFQSNGQLSATSFKSDSIKSSLTGPVHFKIDKGTYTGIDLTYWWHIGNDLVKVASTAAIPGLGTITDIASVVDVAKYKNTNQTKFTDISGDISFKNGIGHTNNLMLYNDIIYVKAQGQIDIVNKKVDLKLFISQSSGNAPKGTQVPFILKGEFGHITVKPDLANFPGIATSTADSVTQSVTNLSKKVPEDLQEPVQKLGNALGNLLNAK